MQQFNQRVISGLAEQARAAGAARPRVLLMGDRAADLPANVAADISGFGRNRLAFIRQSLAAARTSSVLLVGQLNLLPVAWMAKILNPKLRTILFVHGIEVWNDPVYRRKRWYEPFLFRSIDTVASVSRFTASLLHRHFGVGPERVVIFPNAVDGPVAQAPIEGRPPVSLAVSRLAPHDRGKHIDVVLRAFAKVLAARPDARLDIVGDGALRPELEALARSLGVDVGVSFRGRVSDTELAECYGRAQAFVLPSSKEGFGIVYLEAWKHGLPVICGREGASQEIITEGEDGFVVDPKDTDALADAMLTLLSDPARSAAMGAAGARKVETHYLGVHFNANLARLLAS